MANRDLDWSAIYQQVAAAVDLLGDAARQIVAWLLSHEHSAQSTPDHVCACLCSLRGHHSDTCGAEASTFEPRIVAGEPYAIPLCGECAAAIADTSDADR